MIAQIRKPKRTNWGCFQNQNDVETKAKKLRTGKEVKYAEVE